MKMHKKLFALLATAAVGLTLTSCGGGGGGGGSTSNEMQDDQVQVTYDAPESLVGSNMSLYLNGKLAYELSFGNGGNLDLCKQYFYNEDTGKQYSKTTTGCSYTYRASEGRLKLELPRITKVDWENMQITEYDLMGLDGNLIFTSKTEAMYSEKETGSTYRASFSNLKEDTSTDVTY